MTETTYKRWSIWMDGFPHDDDVVSISGRVWGTAECLGSDKGFTFSEACQVCLACNGYDLDKFDPVRLIWNGHRLFDNEADARRSYG